MATAAMAELPAGPPSPFSPFRHGGFTLYQLARVFLIIGGQMFIVALQWQVYDLTRSKFHLGMIGLAQFLPNILLTLIGGHVADRLDRKRIVMACAWASAATGALLAWESLRGADTRLAVIYVACGM